VRYCMQKYPNFKDLLPIGERAHDAADCCVLAAYAFALGSSPVASPAEMFPTILARLAGKPRLEASPSADQVHSNLLAGHGGGEGSIAAGGSTSGDDNGEHPGTVYRNGLPRSEPIVCPLLETGIDLPTPAFSGASGSVTGYGSVPYRGAPVLPR
jgi:hypothetical protein